jgi:hypothetical protein
LAGFLPNFVQCMHPGTTVSHRHRAGDQAALRRAQGTLKLPQLTPPPHAASLRSPSQSVRKPTTEFQLGVMGDAGPEITNGLGAFLCAHHQSLASVGFLLWKCPSPSDAAFIGNPLEQVGRHSYSGRSGSELPSSNNSMTLGLIRVTMVTIPSTVPRGTEIVLIAATMMQ